MTTRRTRQNYTKEFKNDAIRLVLDHGYSCNEVARRLGINPSNVTRWVREHERDNEPTVEGGASRKEMEAELRRLRKENKRLQMEREILKKAAAFFAKESSSDMDSSGSR
jgi:transposase